MPIRRYFADGGNLKPEFDMTIISRNLVRRELMGPGRGIGLTNIYDSVLEM